MTQDAWAAHLDPEEPWHLPPEDPHAERLDRISDVLGDGAIWSEPPEGLRDRIVALAASETPAAPIADPSVGDETISPLRRSSTRSGGGRRSTRRLVAWGGATLATAAAAAVAVAFFLPRDEAPVEEELDLYAMIGTELAPAATAEVSAVDMPGGLAITMWVSELPPAPDGLYYAAWLVGDSGTVPVGSFHLRTESMYPVDLWSGVPLDRYPRLIVTLQQERRPAAPSDRIVLEGELTADGLIVAEPVDS